jgi:OmpA-OmpF porin, OOP family
VHAGNEAWSRDFTASAARTEKVASALKQAEQTLEACHLPAPAPVLPKKIVLSAGALFAFNSADLNAISDRAKQELDQFASDVQQVTQVKRLLVNGYTDRLGSTSYNQKLSQQRANAIKQYLLKRGVRVPMIANGFGKRHPVVNCTQKKRTELIACLQPNRRVEIEVVAEQFEQ